MPLSDWQPLPIVTTGDMWTAAQHNTYIRANQQALYDGLTGGHGAGSNVDMVDGRHAKDFVRVDTLAFTPSTTGWYTIAEGNDRRFNRFIILEGSVNRHNILVFDAGWVYSGTKPYSLLREVFYTRYNLRTLLGVRVLYNTANPTYGTAKLQVYLEGGREYHLYQYTLIEDPHWLSWNMVTPVLEDAPTGYDVQEAFVPGNTNWNLVKVFEGSGGVTGWLTSAQKAAMFTVTMDGYTYQNPGGAIDADYPNDGNTAAYNSASWGGGNIYLDAGSEFYLKGVRINVIGDDYNYSIYYWDSATGTWQSIASGGGAYYTSDTEIVLSTPVLTPKVRIYTKNYGDGVNYVKEIHINLANSMFITGVPPGYRVQLLDSAGTLIEEQQLAPLASSQKVGLTSPLGNVAEVRIVKSDGSPWLTFPTWAINGWNSNAFMVLSLVHD